MSHIQSADNNASYTALNLFQPATAHEPEFSAALAGALLKIDARGWGMSVALRSAIGSV
jgi:hypothetical protein